MKLKKGSAVVRSFPRNRAIPLNECPIRKVLRRVERRAESPCACAFAVQNGRVLQSKRARQVWREYTRCIVNSAAYALWFRNMKMQCFVFYMRRRDDAYARLSRCPGRYSAHARACAPATRASHSNEAGAATAFSALCRCPTPPRLTSTIILPFDFHSRQRERAREIERVRHWIASSDATASRSYIFLPANAAASASSG